MKQNYNKEYGVIYKAQNNITNEVYIGITTDSIKQRQLDHTERALRGEPGIFYEAIGTYGPEVFTWEQIDTANTVNELALKEKEYVVKYNTQHEGYNSDSGGGIKKQVYQYDLEFGKLVDEFECLQDAAQEIEVTKQDISRACLSVNKLLKDFYWSYVYTEPFIPDKDARKKTVIQLTLEGEKINKFSSVAQAAKRTGVSKSGIAKACRGLNKTAGDYCWKYNQKKRAVRNGCFLLQLENKIILAYHPSIEDDLYKKKGLTIKTFNYREATRKIGMFDETIPTIVLSNFLGEQTTVEQKLDEFQVIGFKYQDIIS